MVVNVKATVWYACYLDEEQEKMVREYARKNNVDFRDTVDALCCNPNFDFELYNDSLESDFQTEEIIDVEEH